MHSSYPTTSYPEFRRAAASRPGRGGRGRAVTARAAVVALLAGLSGCSTIKHTAIDQLGDALAAGGTTFAADNDPQLIQSAAPFSLKLMESLLAERPQHRGLLLAAASGFTQYAFAFVQQDADELLEKDFAAGSALRDRARRLYLRGRDFGLRGLDVAHAGFARGLRTDPRATVRSATAADVPLMYWTAAAWGAAIAQSKDNADLIADLGIVEALIDRAVELNESFDAGALHGFLIAYEMNRPAGAGDPEGRSRAHFARAVTLTDSQQAAPFVTLAESVAATRQNRAEFEQLLRRALAIDAEVRPEWRLVNLVMQRRARWLLGRLDELFLPPLAPDTPAVTASDAPAPPDLISEHPAPVASTSSSPTP
ncbi:MAG: TRAP transporter TatT component family protein [Opitutaceae bacterium]|nr:TRAP transporter TatT component family protein [Opitutaceae bacterium]